MANTVARSLIRVTILTLIFLFGMFVAAHGNCFRTQDIFALTDTELVAAFQSSDTERSYAAVREIMRRSDHMIPFLLQCRGNKKPFYGYGLGNRNSAFLIPLPTGNAKRDKDRVITIEVAALYMISAIFYYDLEFAEAPYLRDGTPIKEHRFNTTERVSAAWQTVDGWYERVKTDGIATLRSKKDSPLRTGTVRFWGECPDCRDEPLGNDATRIKVKTFLETSEDLRNYSRNGYTSTFTGELRPIPENIQLQLKKNLPEYKFHIARMSVLIDPPQTKYDLILVTSANTGDVKSYLWGHYWMIPPASSFARLLEGHNSRSREDAIDTVKSLVRLIAYTATAEVGQAKISKGKLRVELLRDNELFGNVEVKIDKRFTFGRLSMKQPNGKDLRHFVKATSPAKHDLAVKR